MKYERFVTGFTSWKGIVGITNPPPTKEPLMNPYDNLSNEQQSIEACYAAIESLEHTARLRILQYVMQFCDEEQMKKLEASTKPTPMNPS